MAKFGLAYARFAPIQSEVDGSLPTYDYTKVITIGAAMTANLTVNTATGEIYGDNALDEKVVEFVSGSLALDVTDMTKDVESGLFGSTLDSSGELIDSTEDKIPQGGLGYVQTFLRKGVKKYRGVFYPKAQAALANDNSETKGSSVNMSGQSTNLTIYECAGGKWRMRKEFDTLSDAKDYIDGKLGKS